MRVLNRITDVSKKGPTEEILTPKMRRVLVIAFVLLLALGVVFNLTQEYYLFVFSRILIIGLFAISLDFAFGYSGLPSFGHAAMFGMAGYAGALMMTTTTESLVFVLPAVFLTGLVVAAIIAFFTVHTRGIYFAMLTLAFAQLLYIAIFNDLPAALLNVEQVTNGGNGLIGIPRFTVLGRSINSLMGYYYMTLFIVTASFIVLVRIANSPFGRVMEGISVNEERVASIGFNTRRYKILAFALSGGFAGLAGGLFVPLRGLASPGMLYWLTSGQAIIHVLLGGMGTLWGPMLGAGLDILLQEFLAGSQYWKLFIGLVYLFVVVFIPDGIAGLISSFPSKPDRIWKVMTGAIRKYIDSVRGH